MYPASGIIYPVMESCQLLNYISFQITFYTEMLCITSEVTSAGRSFRRVIILQDDLSYKIKKDGLQTTTGYL